MIYASRTSQFRKELIKIADLVRIHNSGDKPLRIGFNSQLTVINPDQDGFLDREAACAHFGVWWTVENGKPIDRKDEVLRIRGLYGCLPGAPVDEHSPKWEDVAPKVDIYEMDGTKVSTVIEDPHGQNIPITERDDEGHMRETMAKMQAQLEQMQGQLDHRDQIIASGIATELPPPDSPESAPRRQRKTPEAQGALQAAGE